LFGTGDHGGRVYANDLSRQVGPSGRHVIEARQDSLTVAIAAPMATYSRVPAGGVRL